MSLPLIAIIFVALLMFAYFSYGGIIAKLFQLDDSKVTPAHKHNDGVDFLPTSKFYLFAQHFSAIAAAGPIAGPIVACQTFGWLPCLLWISLGVVLIGAVHDFSSLTASVRHEGNSIAEVTKEQMGEWAGKAMMLFIWISLVYIIVAFSDITTGSFISRIDELDGVKINFNPGGAVACASIFYLILSLVMGLVQRFLNPPLWLITIIFVPLAFLTSWAGTSFSHLFVFDMQTWAIIIGVYCALASVMPVWLLLQPRGYLGGFILYSAIALGIIGIFFGGYEIKQPMFKGFEVAGATGSLFPFLFVTIACGACSGFHGLVCSGTTSKQVDKESHCHSVGYGAMLAEGFVALIALAVIMIMSPEEVTGMKPGTIYGRGIGNFLTILIGKEHLPFAITFGAMAFSTFVFDTLDVSTRLGRYIFQELTGLQGKLGAVVGTLITISVPTYILLVTGEGMWTRFWVLFGSANQLLAALTLLSITLWLYRNKKRIAYTLLPMLFVLTITLWSLIRIIMSSLDSSTGLDVFLFNAFAASLLILLAIFLVIRALYSWRKIV